MAYAVPNNLPDDVRDALKEHPKASVKSVGRDAVPTFIEGELGQIDGPITVEKVQGALQKLGRLMRADASELSLKRQSSDAAGIMHFSFAQTRRGLPVVGADLLVHVSRSGAIIGVSGNARSDFTINPKAALTAGAAEDRARTTAPSARLEAPTQLVYVVSPGDETIHLAYQVEIGDPAIPMKERVFIDAANGEVVARHPLIFEARNRNTYNAGNTQTLPGTLMRNEASGASADAVLDATHDNAGLTYDYYSATFGRDSINNSGMTISSTVHYDSGYNNAFWDGSRLVFGDGDGSQFSPLGEGLDIVAHEFTHGVTQNSSGLVYSGESGALNEAMSDIFGSMCEAWSDGSISGNTWKIGEDVYTPGTGGDALRYMDNPSQDGVSADHYFNRYTGSADNGGVHWNSGIANLAFKLLVTGGSHPSIATPPVPALGASVAQQIFYAANTGYIGSNCTFSQFRAATTSAARNLYGTSAGVAVSAAWDAVGVPGQPFGTTVTIKTVGDYWLCAEGGGGQIVNATRTSPGSWETFTIVDRNGGTLDSGDIIWLRADNGQYLRAINGGGTTVNAISDFAWAHEEFRIHKASGSGTISSGDEVYLQCDHDQYLCAENGGGGDLNANRSSPGSWETFRVYFQAP